MLQFTVATVVALFRDGHKKSKRHVRNFVEILLGIITISSHISVHLRANIVLFLIDTVQKNIYERKREGKGRKKKRKMNHFN